jgi:putative hemolysin
MVEAAATSGSLNQEAGDIASRAIDLAELRVSHVMVPRTRITALPLAASRAQLIETLRTQQHSRYPVYRESLEDVSGYVLARDAYASLLQGEVNLEAIKREVQFLPATVPAVHALRQLQAARAPLAMVVDETGGLAGLVTVEDVTEELVGDIVAEHERPVTLVQREGPSVATVSGSAPIHEVNRELGLDLDESGGYATIAGLVLDRAQSIPGPGTAVELGPNVLAEVLDVSANQVRRIRLSFNAVDVEKE